MGQVVREAQVTVGYLVSRASTSGGHWETGGGGGEPSGGVVGSAAVGVAGLGGVEGRRRKQAMAWVGETKHEMPDNQWKYYDEKENPSQELVGKLLLAKNCEQINFFQTLTACVQNSRKV